MMPRTRLRLAVAGAAALVSLAVGLPAAAEPVNLAPTTGAVFTGDGPGRRHHGGFRHRDRFFRGGFPVVSPFFFGGFDSFSFGHRSQGCDIFLHIGDIDSYVLCRLG